MKKVLFAVLAAGVVSTAQAQKAGSILVYGDASYNAAKQTDDDGLPGTPDVITKNRTWNFTPGVGYQFNKNWTVGLNFGISGTQQIIDNGVLTSNNRIREIQVGPFVRYTTPINRTFFVFQQINISYLNGKRTNHSGAPGVADVIDTYNGFGINWMPAVGVNFTKYMALNFGFGGLGYEKKNWDFDGPASRVNSNFMFTFGQQFHVGISANLGGKSHTHGHHAEPGMERRHIDTSDDSEDVAPKAKTKGKKSKSNSSDIDE
ncbi:MAG: porin family protein [Bacteroidetes bacterium]|nr:porin family protein [Bacteroidota bacterium]